MTTQVIADANARHCWLRLLVGVMLVVVLVRLGFSLGISRAVLHFQPELQSTDQYHLIASNLLEGHGYGAPGSHLRSR